MSNVWAGVGSILIQECEGIVYNTPSVDVDSVHNLRTYIELRNFNFNFSASLLDNHRDECGHISACI